MTRLDRRSVLAAAGTGLAASLAGCDLLEDDPRTFPGDEVRDVLSQSAPDLAAPVPVRPTVAAVRRELTAVDELLDVVPSTLDADDVPNGVVRRRIRRLHGEATEERNDVSEVESAYRRLQRTPSLRREAGEPAWAYRVATGAATLDGLRATQTDIAAAVADDISSFEYTGDERDRALFVAAELEHELEVAANAVDREIRSVDPSALDAGEFGAWLEHARGRRSVVGHLADRHRARLTDARSFRGPFDRALDRSVDAATGRSLPAKEADPSDVVDRNISDSPAEEALNAPVHRLAYQRDHLREMLSTGRLATGLRGAYRFERDVRAYRAVRDRVADGDLLSVDVASLRRARERAVAAAESTPVDVSAPTLATDMVAYLVGQIRDVDEDVRRYTVSEDELSAHDLADLQGKYAWTAERLAALPAAVDAMDARLEG